VPNGFVPGGGMLAAPHPERSPGPALLLEPPVSRSGVTDKYPGGCVTRLASLSLTQVVAIRYSRGPDRPSAAAGTGSNIWALSCA